MFYSSDIECSPRSVRRRLDNIRMSREVTLLVPTDRRCPVIQLSTEIGTLAYNFHGYNIPQDARYLTLPNAELQVLAPEEEATMIEVESLPGLADSPSEAPGPLTSCPVPYAVPVPYEPSEGSRSKASIRSISPDTVDRNLWGQSLQGSPPEPQSPQSVASTDEMAPRALPPIPWPLSEAAAQRLHTVADPEEVERCRDMVVEEEEEDCWELSPDGEREGRGMEGEETPFEKGEEPLREEDAGTWDRMLAQDLEIYVSPQLYERPRTPQGVKEDPPAKRRVDEEDNISVLDIVPSSYRPMLFSLKDDFSFFSVTAPQRLEASPVRFMTIEKCSVLPCEASTTDGVVPCGEDCSTSPEMIPAESVSPERQDVAAPHSKPSSLEPTVDEDRSRSLTVQSEIAPSVAPGGEDEVRRLVSPVLDLAKIDEAAPSLSGLIEKNAPVSNHKIARVKTKHLKCCIVS